MTDPASKAVSPSILHDVFMFRRDGSMFFFALPAQPCKVGAIGALSLTVFMVSGRKKSANDNPGYSRLMSNKSSLHAYPRPHSQLLGWLAECSPRACDDLPRQ